ncbi:Zinc transporter ZIP [Lachnospiraceae bacterium TWA4]|nr:Zinc transporter ZIP [Lachnospiraceae bacterium TWA4]
MGLLITFVLGLFILFGALASYLARGNHKIEQLSVAMALGALATLGLLEILPEAIEHLGEGNWLEIGFCALIGLGLLKLLDLFIPEHDAHYSHHGHEHSYTEQNIAHVGIVSAIAVTLHNIIEGMAVYSISEESLAAGAMVALGVGLHNIPMGMVLYSTLHKKKNRTIMITLATCSTFIGGILMKILLASISEGVIEHATGVLIAITLGMIVYIVVFELIPMIMHTKKWATTIPGILVGMIVVLISIQLG